MKPKKYDSLGQMFTEHVPEYRGAGWKPFVVTFRWDPANEAFVRSVSDRRCERRLDTYMIPGELERSKGSFRFGHIKKGHGYKKERGDFCLVGGALDKAHLTLFYRRLEMIGGLHYDLAIIQRIHDQLGPLRWVTIMAAEAKVFALRGNSNEKLYKKLMAHYASS